VGFKMPTVRMIEFNLFTGAVVCGAPTVLTMGLNAPTALVVGVIAPTGLVVGASTPTGFNVGFDTPTGLGDGFCFSVTLVDSSGVGDFLRDRSCRSVRSNVTFFRDAGVLARAFA
jgi:hypothetical protein